MRRRKEDSPPAEQKALPEPSADSDRAAAPHDVPGDEDDSVPVDIEEEISISTPLAATSMPPAISMIGEDMEIRGPITTASPLHISGDVTGDITAGDVVIVDHGGQVTGRIQATSVTVRGNVRGPVSSSGRLLIESTGTIHGDVVAKSLHIDDGGQLHGRCSMKSKT